MRLNARRTCDFLAGAQVWNVSSEAIDDEFRIVIVPPERPMADFAKVQVVVTLDGDWMIGTLAGTARACELSGELPPLLCVGIGYPIGHHPRAELQRLRDLTPIHRPECDAFTAAALGEIGTVHSGGAHNMLRFLNSELMPAITDAFQVDMPATLIGSSLGGLFALHAWLTDVPSFDRFLCISPALWWSDRALLRALAARLADTGAPSGRLFLAAGALERSQLGAISTNVGRAMPRDMASADPVADNASLAMQLRRRVPDNPVSLRVFEGEGHASVVGAAISHGLRALVGAKP